MNKSEIRNKTSVFCFRLSFVTVAATEKPAILWSKVLLVLLRHYIFAIFHDRGTLDTFRMYQIEVAEPDSVV